MSYAIKVSNVKKIYKLYGSPKDRLKEIDSVSRWLDRCAVAVNDEMVNDLTKALKSGDRVSILPPVCGG